MKRVFLLLFALVSAFSQAVAETAPIRLTVGPELTNPMGYGDPRLQLGVTYDVLPLAATANFNFNTLAFFEKWCRDLCDGQMPNGGFPLSVPNSMGRESSSAADDVAVILPWEISQSFGYRRILEDNYEMMKRWVGDYENHPKTRDFVNNGFCFGD